MRIVKNNKKLFSIKKEILKILKNKIDEYIKKRHNKLLQKHLKIIKILQFLRQHC